MGKGGGRGLGSRGADISMAGTRNQSGQGGRVRVLVGLTFLLRWPFVVACRGRWALVIGGPMVNFVFKGGGRLAVISGLELDRPWVDLPDGPLHVDNRLSVGTVGDVDVASVCGFFYSFLKEERFAVIRRNAF